MRWSLLITKLRSVFRREIAKAGSAEVASDELVGIQVSVGEVSTGPFSAADGMEEKDFPGGSGTEDWSRDAACGDGAGDESADGDADSSEPGGLPSNAPAGEVDALGRDLGADGGESRPVTTVFLDTETTGLGQTARIVEVAIVDEDGNVLVNSLVDPRIPIPPDATAVHGISDEHVAGMPTLDDLMPTIHSAIAGRTVVIYNASYDVALFPCRLRDAGAIHCALSRFQKLEIARGRGNARLHRAAAWACHEWSGEQHRALADAMAARSVWLRLEEEGVPASEWSGRERAGRAKRATPGGKAPRGERARRPAVEAPPPPRVRPTSPNQLDFEPSAATGIAGKTFVFTGKLELMTRDGAHELVTRLGGSFAGSVNRKVDFLVMGIQDYRRFVDGERGSKQKAAEELAGAGHPIQIIDEVRFRSMLGIDPG